MNRENLDSVLKSLDALPDATRIVIVYPDAEPTLRPLRSLLSTTRWSDASLVPAHAPQDGWSPLSYAGDLLDTVELVCVIGPATGGKFPLTNVRAAERNARDAVLGSLGYVARLIDTFARRPRLGMLVPPRSLHSTNFGGYGHEWGGLFEEVKDELVSLGLRTPIDRGKGPLAPSNGTFWIRGDIMASPEFQRLRETAARGDLLLLLLPFVVQARGRFSSYGMPDFLAVNFLTNFTHITRRGNQRLGVGADDSFSSFQSRLQAVSIGMNLLPPSFRQILRRLGITRLWHKARRTLVRWRPTSSGDARD
jgi:hypothetical protein